ncbi:GAF domain-containing protein [Candidatus Sumerlaeota bacterium]|nr:GAF domain-containing protein [Candidatus Sumerlaeota bacterium]
MADRPIDERLTASQDERVVDALSRVSNFMSEVTDIRRLLTLIMEETERVMNSDASACMLYDGATDEMYFEVTTGEKADEVKSIRLKRGQGFGGICLAEERTLIVNNVQQDQRHDSRADAKSQFVTRNLVATPMRHRGEMIGVLEVLNKKGRRDYDDGDAQILRILADQAAIAIVNARLVEHNIQRERLAAIGVAVSGVAHHLKNLIATMKPSLPLLRQAAEKQNVRLMETILPILERGASRMEQSVQEMLAYSKEREPELERTDLNRLVREILEESRPRADQAMVDLREEFDSSIGEPYLDKHRLHDAILNIVSNAIEAQMGSGKESYVAARTRIGRQGGVFVIEIEDNGPGIDEVTLSKIFQPFFSTKGSKGTGLGLAVAQKVAEENGGSLTAQSVVGRGTTFTFRLPIIESLPERKAATEED